MVKPREQVTLTFEPLPSSVPAANRVRQLLKHALRSLGLKCVAVGPVKAEAKPEQPKG